MRDGLVRTIGVSNFKEKHFQELLQASSVVPAVNQIELHPYLTQKALVKLMRQLGVQVESYSPLGRGVMQSERPRPTLLKDPKVKEITITLNWKVLEIAKNHNCTAAQVVLRWNIQQNIVTIPKR